jgi:hypothetical protein
VDLQQGETPKIVFEEIGSNQKEEIPWEELRAVIVKALDGFPEAKVIQILDEARQ